MAGTRPPLTSPVPIIGKKLTMALLRWLELRELGSTLGWRCARWQSNAFRVPGQRLAGTTSVLETRSAEEQMEGCLPRRVATAMLTLAEDSADAVANVGKLGGDGLPLQATENRAHGPQGQRLEPEAQSRLLFLICFGIPQQGGLKPRSFFGWFEGDFHTPCIGARFVEAGEAPGDTVVPPFQELYLLGGVGALSGRGEMTLGALPSVAAGNVRCSHSGTSLVCPVQVSPGSGLCGSPWNSTTAY